MIQLTELEIEYIQDVLSEARRCAPELDVELQECEDILTWARVNPIILIGD